MRRIVIVMALCLYSLNAHAESAAGVRWTAPSGWKNQGAGSMRAATYTMGPAAGDTAPTECAVYFFGAGQGGSVSANMDRWKGQFTGPGGKPALAQIAKRTVRALMVTTIDVSGDYSGLGGPMAAAPRTVHGYRLLGAIVEAPGGNVFLKLTGPAKTVAANRQGFEQLLGSLQHDR